MRLLEKKSINIDLARQKKEQIDTGVALATKVDVLRETVLKEEGNLSKFRTQTISQVQKEIDDKVQERDFLERGNVLLRDERIRLSAPIDLTEAWEEVKTGKAEISDWRERLSLKEVYAIAREGENSEKKEELSKREENIKSKELLTERTLIEAGNKHEKASQTLEKASQSAEKLISDAKARELAVAIREEDISLKEKDISEREQKNSEHEIDLANRERALKDRYETFIRAQNYINNQK